MRNLFSGIGALLKTAPGIIIFMSALWHGVVWWLDIPFNPLVSLFILGIDIAIALFLLDRLIYFFSQFVLPIQNPKHRQEIYTRVRNFSSGNRGPAIFIKNGRVIEHEGERGKAGPGVVLLDTASAAVLRTDIEFKDTVGPGIKFTKMYDVNGKGFSEFVADSVDLRIQWQFIGPRAGENLTTQTNSKKQKMPPAALQQTSGLTRDGVEVSPTISVKFRLKRPDKRMPTESGVTSHYGYDEQAVRNAVTREVVQLGSSEGGRSRMEWDKFPEHLVVNIWREYIRKFKLEDLFANHNGLNGLQVIEEMINKRVKEEYLEGLDDTGARTMERIYSAEYKQLQARGLEILDVRIHDIHLDPANEDLLSSQWNAEWMKIAKKDETLLNEQEALLKTNARNEAVKRFTRIVTKKFDNPIASEPDPYALLQDLIQPLRESILSENTANREVDTELRKLDEIWKWLLVNKFIFDNQKGQDNP